MRREARSTALVAATSAGAGAIPSSALPLVAVASIACGAVVIAVARIRRIEEGAARDARLAAAVRDEVAGGRIPEARDRLRREEGPLARVLRAVFRFPYGVHREAVELGWSEALAAESRAHGGGAAALPALVALALVAGVASDLALAARVPLFGSPTVLGLAGAAVAGAAWARLRVVARRASRALESSSGEIAERIVAFTESPQMVELAEGATAHRERPQPREPAGRIAGVV
jgi:hypothetical protein